MWKDGKFTVPDDIKVDPGKVTEYYDAHYGERYSDYDQLKTKAAEADEWGKFGDREALRRERETFTNVQKALQQGKVIVADEKGTMWAKDPSELTAKEKKQIQAQGDLDDWLPADYDELTPRQQAAAQRKAYQQMLSDTVASKEQQYGKLIQDSQGGTSQQINTLLEIQSAIQEHPELKLRDVLAKMAEHAAKGNSNPLKAALDDYLTPAQIEQKAKAMAAEIIAAEKLKTDKEKAEKVLATQGSPLARMMRGGKQSSGKVTNDQLLSMLNEKGLLQ